MWNKGAAIRPLTRLFVMAVRREAPGGAADVTLSGRTHETGDPFAHDWMIVEGEYPNWRAAGHDASPSTSAGALAANRRDHHERLADVA
jgi:hypothetical protein